MGSNQVVYIRVDANREIATGHVMRTLAIAKQIRQLGGECKFIVSDGYAIPIIHKYGFEVICLESQWNDLEQEIPQIQQLIIENKIKIILVDSYYVTKKYLECLQSKTYVAYIDDLNLFCYPVNLVINYSIYHDRFQYKTMNYSSRTNFLLGCSYIPLRDEFVGLVRSKKERVTDILITTGGTDKYHVTYSLLEYLCKNHILEKINIHAVIGRFNKDEIKIKQLADIYDYIYIYKDINYMSELMMKCDIGISAGGTTLFELCACGLPTICFSMADNQILGTESLADKGYMYNIGDIRCNINERVEDIVRQLNYLIQDYDIRHEYSNKMQILVDGRGAERIAKYLLNIS